MSSAIIVNSSEVSKGYTNSLCYFIPNLNGKCFLIFCQFGVSKFVSTPVWGGPFGRMFLFLKKVWWNLERIATSETILTACLGLRWCHQQCLSDTWKKIFKKKCAHFQSIWKPKRAKKEQEVCDKDGKNLTRCRWRWHEVVTLNVVPADLANKTKIRSWKAVKKMVNCWEKSPNVLKKKGLIEVISGLGRYFKSLKTWT